MLGQAINTIKANAAGLTRVNNVKAEPHKELIKPKSVHSTESHSVKAEHSTELPKNQSSSVLPPNFFDNNDTKKLKTEESSNLVSEIDRLPNGNFGKAINIQPAGERTSTSEEIAGSKINQAKGALPEGFFDNKDADLRARGIKPVKPDIKDEYKEFEKLIQEDLQEVDDRFEEEEIDAAETIEEAESVEQKTYWEKVEMLKKKKLELQVARSVKRRKASEGVAKESRCEESSSDDENFAVDWTAQHL
ncbi:hypothetical protein CMV_018739 [Castanea mollissima]|uniref:ZNF380 coiled-coil domain-containing protein n=1 Tax=Castanea mollissima TaxID=60419 RepID=A0A8J4R1S5_9ROSI|nr:hypothetical protein CMV_018739 [Castanea mollissima]